MAERAEEQAAKLSEQQQDWPAAARAWQLAADRFALLNDIAAEAVALHNLAQAQRELGQAEEARKNLEQAATLNERLGRTNEWWRNEIVLLQIDAQSLQHDPLKERFEKLQPLAGKLADRSIHGLFLNELGLWQTAQGQLAGAEKTFAAAEQNFKIAKDSFGLAVISANRAELCQTQKNYPAAIASWRSALTIFQSLHDPQGITRSLAGQGRALLAAKQDLPLAEDALRRAARNYHTLQKPKQAQATHELLAQCLTAEGKDKEAGSVRSQMQKTSSAADSPR